MRLQVIAHGLVLLLTQSSFVLAQEVVTPQEARKTVERLINLPHGFYRMNQEDRVVLQRVMEKSEPYVTALEARYSLEEIRAVVHAQSEQQLQLERAVQLLGRIGTESSQDLMSSWYQHLTTASLDLKFRKKALHTKRVLFGALQQSPTPALLEKMMPDLETLDDATFNAAANYLLRTAKGDTRVGQSLQQLLERPSLPKARKNSLRSLQQKLLRR